MLIIINFDKLCSRQAPPCFVGLIINWYSKLYSCVRWNGVFSDFFGVSCGVRQGGILSPILFNLYVDDLLVLLHQSGYRCYVSKTFIKTFIGCIICMLMI